MQDKEQNPPTPVPDLSERYAANDALWEIFDHPEEHQGTQIVGSQEVRVDGDTIRFENGENMIKIGETWYFQE